MSVFDGEIEFKSMYMVDYVKRKPIPRVPLSKYDDDNCLIIGINRDTLKPREDTEELPDVVCPIAREHYKGAVKRFEGVHPKLCKMYMSKDIDLQVIDNDMQDSKKTEYITQYCKRGDPFMSNKLGQRAMAMHSFRLPDDACIPDTIYTSSYRQPKPETYAIPPSEMTMKPVTESDDALKMKLREICRVKTGETTYEVSHSLLGKLIREHQPFGPARKEPRYGRWKTPSTYTYRIN